MKIINQDGQPISLDEVAQFDPRALAITTEEPRPMANDPSIQITRLRIRNFRGIASLDVPVGPGGAIFAGTNGEGKTTAIESINAALEGVGIGAEAIRIGADKSEILVDLDKVEESTRTKLEVKRSLSRSSGPKIAITGSDGVPLPKPKEQLAALFGGRALDPLEFYLADAKEQRRIVLSANPVQVTAEDLTRWTGEEREWNTSGHGQEVLARVRQMFFDQRTKAGQVADQAKASVTLKAQEADRLAIEAPETMTPEAARSHVTAAERELAVLRDRSRQVVERQEAAAGTRARIAKMRAQAEEKMGQVELQPPHPDEMAVGTDELLAAKAAVEDAKKVLQAAEKRFDAAKDASAGIEKRMLAAQRLQGEVDALVSQANELEAAIAGDDDLTAIAEQTVTAEAAMETASALVTKAEVSAKWRAAKAEVVAAEMAQAAADAAWTKLDTIVKTLTVVAPAEIAGRADLIPGLEVTPDAILLDGKDITLLCGAEKMGFAVALAKRMAGKAKILTVDGLEQIAPSKQAEFVRLCLEGGWTLFATVVADGAMQVIDAYTFAKQAA
jgi:hypothetical protein